jgi:negative regulator of replication initiation
MSIAMISVASDVLTRLLALRMSETESLDDVLRRALPPIGRSAEAPTARIAPATRNPNGTGVPYQIDGELHLASDATEAMINILNDLAQYDDSFFPKLAAKVQGRTRNHIARSRSEVYPDRPDLARYVKEIGPGWFIGCNIANREKEKILHAACEVMGISFGRDLKIELRRS